MPALKTQRNGNTVISALRARANFGKLLQQVEEQRGSLVIEKRGRPRAILLSIRDYVRLATPEPEVLKLLGAESRSKGKDKLSTKQISFGNLETGRIAADRFSAINYPSRAALCYCFDFGRIRDCIAAEGIGNP